MTISGPENEHEIVTFSYGGCPHPSLIWGLYKLNCALVWCPFLVSWDYHAPLTILYTLS